MTDAAGVPATVVPRGLSAPSPTLEAELPLAATATARNLTALLLRAWRVRVTGAHLVPMHGPCLLVANHSAVVDVAVLFGSAPRPVHVVTEAALAVPPFDRVLHSAGHIRYDSTRPDRAALQLGVRALNSGRAVAAFAEPEMGRGEVDRVGTTAAYLAALSGAPIVPVALLGTRRSGRPMDSAPGLGARIEVMFGPVWDMDVSGYGSTRGDLRRLAEQIRQKVKDHVDLARQRTGVAVPELPETMTSPKTKD